MVILLPSEMFKLTHTHTEDKIASFSFFLFFFPTSTHFFFFFKTSYWEEDPLGEQVIRHRFPPYKVTVVGCTCEPHLAVARGLRRMLLVGRGVPILPQLRSHKLFSTNFPAYCDLCDEVMLYDTSGNMDRPIILAHKVRGTSSIYIHTNVHI